MLLNSEEKLKIVVQSCIGTTLICSGQPVLGGLCFALMLPWGAIGRIGGWLASPVVGWRRGKGNAVEAKA